MSGNGIQRLFTQNPGPAKPATEQPEQEADADDLGPCAAIAKSKWITALTIRHARKPWESFQFSYIGVRSTFENHRFEVPFVSHDEAYKVVVTGRNLAKYYNLIIQGRLEWIKAADRDDGKDGEPIILNVEVVKLGENAG